MRSGRNADENRANLSLSGAIVVRRRSDRRAAAGCPPNSCRVASGKASRLRTIALITISALLASLALDIR